MNMPTARTDQGGVSTDGRRDAAAGKGLTDRNTATIIGALFIIGTAAGVLSWVVTGPIMGAPDYLAQIAAHPSRMALGALLVMTMVFSLSMVPVVFYPVGRRYSEVLAMGYVVFRGALESIFTLVNVGGWLVLVALSKQPTAATASIADAIKVGHAVLTDQLISIPFVLGALMFYWLLYTSKLVPRWLSVWGLVGAVLYIGVPLLRMFGLSFDYLYGPLALQEMVMALWLIARGFSSPARALKVA